MSFLHRLLRGRRLQIHDTVASASTPPDQSEIQYRLGSDEDHRRNRDVLVGLQFVATLSLDTPHHVLEHHGEVHHGLPSTAPRYGEASDGIWVPIVNWAGLGISPPDEGTMASSIGPVPTDGGDLLAFLIEFRQVVESNKPIKEKLRHIDGFSKSTPEYQQIRRRLGVGFAKAWFAEQLTVVPGIGPKAANALFDAGFQELEALRSASDAALLGVAGVGSATVKKIRAYLSDRPPNNRLQATRSLPCFRARSSFGAPAPRA